MISKGCTCKHTFAIPFTENQISAIFITYQQDQVTKIEKELSDCEFADGTVSVKLSQEDTLKFDDNAIIKIQIRVKLISGAVTKSEIIETFTDDVLKDGVI